MKRKSVLVVDYKERIIWLNGYITPSVGCRFKRILDKLNRLKCFPIILYVRGPGGDPYIAFSMMADIADSKSPVAIVAHDYVYSACFLITQAGAHRLALPGTKFGFHPAITIVSPRKDEIGITQTDHMRDLRTLMRIDGVQLYWFTKKSRPVEKISDLFTEGATIGLRKAIKLRIMDGFYSKKDFLEDKRIINKRIKVRSKARKRS